jgi:hypothetical protein
MADVKKLMVSWLEGTKHTVCLQIGEAWKHPRFKRMIANEASAAP